MTNSENLSKKDVQTWLDENYPREERKEVQEIYLNKKGLAGELNLADFTHWGLKIYISHYVDENKLVIKNKIPSSEIVKLTDAQDYINQEYPTIEERERAIELNINDKNLEGELDLVDFVNLKKLDFHNNKLTNLNVSNCSHLTVIDCYNNLLTHITLPLSSALERLDLSSNNFSERDFSFLIPYINLQWLYLGNYDDHRWKGIKGKVKLDAYNKFVGSLDFLSGMSQLNYLDIRNIDISEVDLIKLPSNLYINYLSEESPGKLKKVARFLSLFNENKKEIEQWKKFGFVEINSWMEIGLSIYEYKLADYLKKQGSFNLQKIKKSNNLTELRREFYDIRNDRLSDEIIKQIRNFKHPLNFEQELLVNSLILDEELSQRYKKHGLCQECYQPNKKNIGESCQSCITQHFSQNFQGWTSSNLDIDQFIKDQQLKAISAHEILEWIPYDKFANIKYLAQGGFGKVYKAKWIDGPIKSWNVEDSQWKRDGNKDVALKSLNDSQEIKKDFLQEITCHKLFDDSDSIVQCCGISQNLQNGDYLMVLEYVENGSLRQCLQNYRVLDFRSKFSWLGQILKGLKSVHDKGLIHKDFHPGNILNNNSGIGTFYITDLGLCRPVNETNNEKIYGVLSYIAPEVLRGQPYTQASDIYSFGMVAYELLSEKPPYQEYVHDELLAIRICQGLRPNMDEFKAPQLLKDLIKRCWSADLIERPTTNKLARTLNDWWNEMSCNNTKFYYQYQESKKFNKKSFFYKLYLPVFYRSSSLDYKDLPEPQNNEEMNKKFWGSKQNNIPQPMEFPLTELQGALEEMKLDNNSQFSQPVEFNSVELNQVNWEEIIGESVNWTSCNFTSSQIQSWLSAGLQLTDHHFATWLRDFKQLTPEEVLNQANYEQLREEYQDYQQLQSHREVPPKSS